LTRRLETSENDSVNFAGKNPSRARGVEFARIGRFHVFKRIAKIKTVCVVRYVINARIKKRVVERREREAARDAAIRHIADADQSRAVLIAIFKRAESRQPKLNGR